MRRQIEFFKKEIIGHEEKLSRIKTNLLAAQEKFKNNPEEMAKYDAMIDYVCQRISWSDDLIKLFDMLLANLTKPNLDANIYRLEKIYLKAWSLNRQLPKKES